VQRFSSKISINAKKEKLFTEKKNYLQKNINIIIIIIIFD